MGGYISLSEAFGCWLLVLVFFRAAAFFSIVTYLIVVIVLNVFFAYWVLLSCVKLYGPCILPIYYCFLVRLPGICFIPIVVLLKVFRGIALLFYILFVEPVVKFDG